jgi:hypothetical protein
LNPLCSVAAFVLLSRKLRAPYRDTSLGPFVRGTQACSLYSYTLLILLNYHQQRGGASRRSAKLSLRYRFGHLYSIACGFAFVEKIVMIFRFSACCAVCRTC